MWNDNISQSKTQIKKWSNLNFSDVLVSVYLYCNCEPISAFVYCFSLYAMRLILSENVIDNL